MRSEIHPQGQMKQFLHAEADEAYEVKDWRRTVHYSKKILDIDSMDSHAESLLSQANQKIRHRILKWMFAISILGGFVLQSILFDPLAQILGQNLVSSSLHIILSKVALFWVLGCIPIVIYFYFKTRGAFDEYANASTKEEFKERKEAIKLFITGAVFPLYMGIWIIFGMLGAYHHGFFYPPNYFPPPNHPTTLDSGGIDGLSGVLMSLFGGSFTVGCLVSIFMRIVRAVSIRQIR